MNQIPSKFQLAGVPMPPLLIAGLSGAAAAVATGKALDRYRLSRYFSYPPRVFVALSVIYTCVFGTVIVKV